MVPLYHKMKYHGMKMLSLQNKYKMFIMLRKRYRKIH